MGTGMDGNGLAHYSKGNREPDSYLRPLIIPLSNSGPRSPFERLSLLSPLSPFE